MSSPSTITNERSEKEFDLLRIQYLKENRFSFSCSLMFRVLGMIILGIAAVSVSLAFANDLLSNIFGVAIVDRVSSILGGLASAGMIVWAVKWDDRRRFAAFLANSKKEAEQGADDDAEEAV